MQRYHAYIARNLGRATLLVAVCLISIVWLTQALRLLDFIVNQGISVRMFLTLTLLLVPSLLMLIIPIAVLCALLFFYHKLKSDSELVALQAAGLDKWKLARPALTVALLATLAGYVLSLYVMPLSYARFKEMQSFLRNNYVSVLLQEGVFASPVGGLTVFIRERGKDGLLTGVLVHDNRDPAASVTMMAEKAELVQSAGGPRFLLSNGNRQEMRNGQLSFLTFDSYALDMNLYTESMASRALEPQERFVGDLLYSEGKDARDTERMRAEAHQRLTWPGYALTLTLVALAVVLTGEFNRRARWQRNLAAAGLCAGLLFLAAGLRNLMAGSGFFTLFTYAVLVVPALISLAVLQGRRPRFFPPPRAMREPD